MSKEEKIITANEYRKNIFKEIEVTVPSGAKFKIQRLSPIDFIKNGLDDIPNPFLEFVQSEKKVEDLQKASKDKETNKFLNDFLGTVIEKGIVQPKVIVKFDKEKKDECLFWSEISPEDQTFLVNSIVGIKE